MRRGMSMMKSSVKRVGALIAAAVMVCVPPSDQTSDTPR